MGRRYCTKTKRPKVAYESLEVAEIALEDVLGDGHRRRRGNGGKRPSRVYACDDHFHLTSWVSETLPPKR